MLLEIAGVRFRTLEQHLLHQVHIRKIKQTRRRSFFCFCLNNLELWSMETAQLEIKTFRASQVTHLVEGEGENPSSHCSGTGTGVWACRPWECLGSTVPVTL